MRRFFLILAGLTEVVIALRLTDIALEWISSPSDAQVLIGVIGFATILAIVVSSLKFYKQLW